MKKECPNVSEERFSLIKNVIYLGQGLLDLRHGMFFLNVVQ